MQNRRVDWLDAVKFIGIFAIVWGHTLNDGLVRQYLYSFHVPLFFFVAGIYFTSKGKNFWVYLKNKVATLLLPYFSFAFTSIIVFFFLGKVAASALAAGEINTEFLPNILEMFTGSCRANRPLWFLPCMFCFYMLCYPLDRFLDHMPKTRRYVAVGAVIVVSVSLCAVDDGFWKLQSLFWKAETAIFMLAFFCVGYLLQPILKGGIRKRSALVLAVMCLLCGGLLALKNGAVDYISNQYGNVLIFYLSASLTITGLCFLCASVPAVGVVKYIGQRTLPILLMHKFPILFFQVIFPWTKALLKNNNELIGFLVAVVSIGACLGVDMLLIRFLPEIVGGKRVSKKYLQG